MNLRTTLRLLVLTLLGSVSGGVVTASEQPGPPNVILLLADDLGWGDVGFHGSRIATPNLDALADRGVRLEQFYVQPVCSPTRGALLTGRYPMRLGLQCGVVRPWATHGLPQEETTLPQALKQAGYETAIVGKWHLGHARPEQLPTRRGFDHQYGHYNGMLDYFTHLRDGSHDWHRNDQPCYDEGYSTELLADEACRLLADRDAKRPLFLYVPFNAPHTPLQVPRNYLERYADLPNPARRTYAAMVTCLDAAVGRILQAVKSHLPADNTLVIFCSDNGGVTRLGSNGPFRSGKGTLYEGGIRVPAIMAWPGVLPPGKQVDEPLHIVDLFPTLLGLTGVKLPNALPLDGRDAWPTIKDGQPSPHEFILHNVTPFGGALRVGDWKLVHNGHMGANATSSGGPEQFELFNLRSDIAEEHDLSAEEPEILARLKQQLATLADTAEPANIPPNRAPAGFTQPKVWGHPNEVR